MPSFQYVFSFSPIISKKRYGWERSLSELNGYPVLGVIDQVNSVHRALEKPKNEFHLPAVRIQEHHLECREIVSVSQQQKLERPDPEGDQAIQVVIGIVGAGNELVTDVPKHKANGRRDLHREHGVTLILQVGTHPEDQMGLGLKDVMKQAETDIAAIGNVGDTGC